MCLDFSFMNQKVIFSIMWAKKIRWTLVWIVWVSGLLSACHQGGGEITLAYFEQQSSMSDPMTREDSLFLRVGLVEYDSVRFSDGSYAVHRLRHAPQNSLTEFFDSCGRTIATVARASECYAQTLVYGYDPEGRLTHLVRYKSEIFEGLEPDSAGYGRSREGYLGFRRMIEEIDYERPDTARYELTRIEYDPEGNAVRACTVPGNSSIVAPRGYKLSVSVAPCVSFWESDLDGGFYIFHVTLEPRHRQLPRYRVCRYADFMPSVESHYQDGRIVKTVWHPDPHIVNPDARDLVFIPVRKGELNVYTETGADGRRYQSAYREGRLAYKQEISKYGTTLKRKTYTFTSPHEVKVVTEAFDYRDGQLKPQSETVREVGDGDMYREEMDVVNENYIWADYYPRHP